MILDDFRNFIVQNEIATEEIIKYDYDSSKGEDVLLLTLYDTVPCDLALRSSVSIVFKFNDLRQVREDCFVLYSLLFPQDYFQKAIKINGKIMHLKLNKGPLYSGLDQSKRHNYMLDITVTYER